MLVTWYFSTFEALSEMIPLVFFQTWQQSNYHIGFFQAPRTRAWGKPSGATAVDVFATPEGWISRKPDCGFSSWRHSGSTVLSFVFLSRMGAPIITWTGAPLPHSQSGSSLLRLHLISDSWWLSTHYFGRLWITAALSLGVPGSSLTECDTMATAPVVLGVFTY